LASLRNLTRRTVSNSQITMDDQGGLWLTQENGQSETRVGLSANTLMEPASDARTGYLVALSRVDAELRKKPKNRETLGFFRQDWELMERLRGKAVPFVAGRRPAEMGGGTSQ